MYTYRHANSLFSDYRNTMWLRIFKIVGTTLFLVLPIVHAARRTGMYHSSEVASSLRFLSPHTENEGGDQERAFLQDNAEMSTKLANWLSENQLPDKVLHLMELPKRAEEILVHPTAELWFDYVKKFRYKHPTTEESPFSILLKLSTKEKISAVIDTLKYSNYPRYEKFLAAWRQFCKFGEESEIKQSVYRDNFIKWWVRYTATLNMEKESNEIMSMTRLMRHYLNDRDILGKVVVRFTKKKKNDKEKVIAKEIKDIILRDWVTTKKVPYVALYELKFATKSAIGSPLYRFWLEYLDAYNEKWMEIPLTNVEVFLRLHTLRDISEMIYTAETSDSHLVAEAGRLFKFQLLNSWLSYKKSPQQLYQQIQAEGIELNLWLTYLDYYTTRFGGGENWLKLAVDVDPDNKFTLLQAALKQKNLMNDAHDLILEEGDKVLHRMNMSPEQVFEHFRLIRTGKQLWTNPLFEKWLEYSKIFQQVHPKDLAASWIVILEKSYNKVDLCYMIKTGLQNSKIKDMVQEVENALLKLWLDTNTSPETLFLNLMLTKRYSTQKFLTRPTFMMWAKYLHKLYKRNDVTEMILIIKSHLAMEDISSGLQDALRDPDTKELAIKLQKALNRY